MIKLIQEAFFDTGASVNFDTLGVWDTFEASEVGPFDEVIQAIPGLSTLEKKAATKLVNLLSISEFGSEQGTDADAPESNLDSPTPESNFVQSLVFSAQEIIYDFYLQ
jgi:hypothetical protein